MPTNKKQFSMVVDDEFLQMIDDYRFTHRLKSRNVAINDLINHGIVALQAEKESAGSEEPAPKQLTEADIKSDPMKSLEFVLRSAGFLNSDGDISDSDLEFLKALFLLIKAHFNK